jgi:excisionase family DNA binding protein
MTPQPDLSDWLTAAEAAAVIGVSEKTLYRMTVATDRQPVLIQKQTRRRPGLPPVSVFHPDDVARQRYIRNPASKPFIMPTKEPVRPESDVSDKLSVVPLPRPEVAAVLLTLVGQVVDRLCPPRYMTVEQAVRYTGLSAGCLDRLVRQDRLRRVEEGVRGFRYRREDLDALAL